MPGTEGSLGMPRGCPCPPSSLARKLLGQARGCHGLRWARSSRTWYGSSGNAQARISVCWVRSVLDPLLTSWLRSQGQQKEWGLKRGLGIPQSVG